MSGEGWSRRNAEAAQERELHANSSSPVIAAFKGNYIPSCLAPHLIVCIFFLLLNIKTTFFLPFKVFQQELDTRHDKYERLVKLSRDVTIESKRSIFLLHRVTKYANVFFLFRLYFAWDFFSPTIHWYKTPERELGRETTEEKKILKKLHKGLLIFSLFLIFA